MSNPDSRPLHCYHYSGTSLACNYLGFQTRSRRGVQAQHKQHACWFEGWCWRVVCVINYKARINWLFMLSLYKANHARYPGLLYIQYTSRSDTILYTLYTPSIMKHIHSSFELQVHVTTIVLYVQVNRTCITMLATKLIVSYIPMHARLSVIQDISFIHTSLKTMHESNRGCMSLTINKSTSFWWVSAWINHV